MALTTLDPKTALIVVDLQEALRAYPTMVPIDGIFAKAGELAKAFRAHGLPVILVTVAGGAPGRTERPRPASGERPANAMDVVADLDQQPSDHLVVKSTWGAFMNTKLDEGLKHDGVTQVVIAGVATSAGVESTARQAHEHGYNVTLAVDAMADGSQEVHDHSVNVIFPRIGETGTTAEIIALLDATR